MSHAARGTVYIKPKFGPYKNYGRKIFDTKKLFLKKLSFKRWFLKYLDTKWPRYGHSKRMKFRISASTLVIHGNGKDTSHGGGGGGGWGRKSTPGPSSLHPGLKNVTFKRSALSYDCLFLTSETLWRMGTSFRCSDFRACLAGQALVMIGRWYSPVISTCNAYRPEMVVLRACTGAVLACTTSCYSF